MLLENFEVFDKNWKKYDAWYNRNPAVFQSELKAISAVIPSGCGLEIGVGTGRFASFFRLPFGVDPAFSALRLSAERDIKVVQGKGEELPFKDKAFYYVLIVATICFVNDPPIVLKETHRVLKPGGTLVLAIINRSSAWGRFLMHEAPRSTFLKNARFYEAQEMFSLLQDASFRVTSTIQTLFQTPPEVEESEEPQKGFGKGGFVVFEATKKSLSKTEESSKIQIGKVKRRKHV
jgi:SAM-dependent methyltransferase